MTISSAERADLAPTGRLRVGIMYTNPVIAGRNAASGQLHGISVDLAHELARSAGLALDLVGYETTAAMLAGLGAGAWDVAFTALAPEHAGELDFTAPYIETEGTYLVRAEAPWRTPDEVDREGVRIAVSGRSSLDLHLTGSLRHAQLVRIPGAVGAFDLFLSGKADVLAGVRQRLLAVAPQVPGARILAGRFMVIENGAAIPRGRTAGARYLHAFVEHAKASGLVSRAIAANGIQGASVAPAATAG